MSQVLIQIPGLAAGSRPGKAATAKQVRFVAEAPAGATVVRAFEQPRKCVAIVENIDMSTLPAVEQGEAPTDRVTVVLAGPDTALESRKTADGWMAAGSGTTIAFAASGQKIHWRPGRIFLQAPPDAGQETLATLVEFAFYDSELRRMENALAEIEKIAPRDVARAHRIRFRDRKHWKRIGETIESLYRIRLEYARLEAQLVNAPLAAARDARPILERLADETGIKDRLEAFSNRLEACEDLYEGANDRIADHRWYTEGYWLEVTIIFLLVIEVALLSADLYLKHWK